jgi:hypothetical protein
MWKFFFIAPVLANPHVASKLKLGILACKGRNENEHHSFIPFPPLTPLDLS